MSSIRLKHTSFINEEGGSYVYENVGDFGLFLRNSDLTSHTGLNVGSAGEGPSDTSLAVYGSLTSDFTDAENISMNYNGTNYTYEIRTNAIGNGSSRPIAFRTFGNSDQIRIQTDGSILFPQTTNSSTTHTGSVVFNGGLGVARSIWSDVLNTVNDASIGGVLSVDSTLDSDVGGTGSARFAGGIYAAKSLVLGNVIQNKRIVLWNDGGGVDDFIGLGVDANGVGAAKGLRIQLPGISSQLGIFRADSGGGSSSAVFSVSGDGTTKLYGDLNMNNFRLKSVADPVDAYDGVNKRYVDEVINNFDPKESVQVATVYACVLNTDLTPGQVVDDIALTAGMRVLVKTQVDPVENGVYIVQSSGAPLRSDDMQSGSTVAGSFFFVESGTRYAHMGFLCSSYSMNDVVGTNALNFVQFSGLGQIVSGSGIVKQDNVISTSPDQSHVTRLGNIIVGEWQSTSVKVAYGGTGLTEVTAGHILYGNGTVGTSLKSTPELAFDDTEMALTVGGSLFIGRASSTTPNFIAFRGMSGNGLVTNTALASVVCERYSISGVLTETQKSATELVIFKGSNSTGDTQDDIRVIAGGSIHFETLPSGATSSYDSVGDVFTGGNSNQPVRRVSINSTSFNLQDGVQLHVSDTTNASSPSSASVVLHGGLSVASDVFLGGIVRYGDGKVQTTSIGSGFAIYSSDTTASDFHVTLQKYTGSGRVSLDAFGVGAIDAADQEGVALLSDGIGGVHYLQTLQKGTGTARPLVLMTGSNANQLRLEPDGSVFFSSSTNATGLISAGAVFSGGVAVGLDAFVGGKLTVGSTLRVSSTAGPHEITGSHIQSAVLVIANKNVAGTAVIGFDDANGSRQLSVGYSPDGTGSFIASTGSLQLGPSTLVNPDGTVFLAHTLDSDATTSGAALSLKSGGLYVSKTVTSGSLYAKSGGLTTATSVDGIHHKLLTTGNRWNVSLAGGETGSNAGSSYTFSAYDDTGGNATAVVKLYRSDKHVEIFGSAASTGVGTGALQLHGGIYAGSDSYFTGSLVSSGSLTTRGGLVLQNSFGQTGWSVVMASGDSSLQFGRYSTTTGGYIDSPLVLRNDSTDILLSGRTIHTSGLFNSPTTGARSSGTRVVLSPDSASGHSDYSFGIGNNDLWTSVPTSSQTISWYSGDQRIFQLSGTGQVVSRNGKSVYNADSLDIGTQAVVFTRFQSENDTGLGNVVASTMTPTVSFSLTSQTTASSMYSIVLPTAASAANGKYVGWYLKIRTGSAVNQVRKIATYDGTTRIAEFSNTMPWTSTRPGSGDVVDLYANCQSSLAFNSTRNEFLTTTSPSTTLSEIEYCDVRANRVIAADGFIQVGYPHPDDNLANRPKTSGDRGIVMKRWQLPNDASLGNVINESSVDFTDTLPSQAGHSTTELVLSATASGVSGAYTSWWVKITSGSNAGQVRKIVQYNGPLRVATLETSWTTQSPAAGSIYSLYAKSEVAVYFDENSHKLTSSYIASPPSSSLTGGSVLSVGLADVKVGSLDATGVFSMTGSITVTSNVTIDAGQLQTNIGSSVAGVTVHHALRDTAGLQRIGVGLSGVVASGNVGADYAVCTYDNSGAYMDTPFQITRSTGNVSINSVSRVLNSSSNVAALNIAGDMTLFNPTSNTILFGSTSSLAAPTYTTRSLGTKLVLCPLLGAFSADFAFGVENQALWSSVPSDTHRFKWYSGTTSVASLKSDGLTIENNGDLNVSGYIDAGSSGSMKTRVQPFDSLTMPLVDSQVVRIPHGVNAVKIVSVTCVVGAVIGGNNVYIPPNRQIDGCMYSVLWTDSDILIVPLEGNATSLLGCPAKIAMTYQK